MNVSADLKAWLECERCGLCKTAHKHVLGRGKLPADVVFCGEGPGVSEDTLGEAFVGPAGRLLEKAIGKTTAGLFFTNLVACRPCDSAEGGNRQPTEAEIEACKPRLLLTLREANHRGVVLCGRLPEHVYRALQKAGEVPPEAELETMHIAHPAWLLRQGGEMSKEFPKYAERLRKYIERSVR